MVLNKPALTSDWRHHQAGNPQAICIFAAHAASSSSPLSICCYHILREKENSFIPSFVSFLEAAPQVTKANFELVILLLFCFPNPGITSVWHLVLATLLLSGAGAQVQAWAHTLHLSCSLKPLDNFSFWQLHQNCQLCCDLILAQ